MILAVLAHRDRAHQMHVLPPEIHKRYPLALFTSAYRKSLHGPRISDGDLLFPVRALRNAAAHNSCLLNTMRDRLTKPIGIIAKLLVSEYGMDCELVGLSKRVPLIHDFSATLMCYDGLVSSEHSRSVCARRLRALSERLSRNRSFFTKQAEVDKGLEMLVALCNTFVVRFEGQ